MPQTLKIAHLVNTFRPPEGSEFVYAQPITVASMLRAQAATPPHITVDLLQACTEADRRVVPEGLRHTAFLDRSVRDVGELGDVPPLPLLADLIQRLYDSSDADYLIFTNIDIAVQPDFYTQVAAAIAEGCDALIVNRRRIPGHYREVAELPAMYAEEGRPHPGFDCFVFRREMFEKFQLGEVCVGIPYIGILMAQNLFCHADNFRLYDEENWTFHIGEDVFKRRNKALFRHNRRAFWQAIESLWPDLDSRKFPYADRNLLARLFRWGLHPSIPIRLCLRLEWRQFWGRGGR